MAARRSPASLRRPRPAGPDHARLRRRRAAAVAVAARRQPRSGSPAQNLLDQRESSATARAVPERRRSWPSSTAAEHRRDRRRRRSQCSLAPDADRLAPGPRRRRPVVRPRDPSSARTPCPPSLRDGRASRGSPRRMRFDLDGDTHLAVGVPLAAGRRAPTSRSCRSSELEDTLESLGVSLLGAVAGHHPGRRRPRLVGRAAACCARCAGVGDGRRGHRRRPARHPARGRATTPTSARWPTSFNDMAAGAPGADRARRPLRLRREPRAALAADDAGGLDRGAREPARRDARAGPQAALDLMVADIDRFQQLVEDLLEISRFDAGVGAPRPRGGAPRRAGACRRCSRSTDADVPVDIDAELAGVVVQADKRRLVRVIANLLDNAAKYGGGATRVALRQRRRRRADRGRGRRPRRARPTTARRIFDRFTRGSSAGHRRGERRRRPRPVARRRARPPPRRLGVGRGPRRRPDRRPLRGRAARGGVVSRRGRRWRPRAVARRRRARSPPPSWGPAASRPTTSRATISQEQLPSTTTTTDRRREPDGGGRPVLRPLRRRTATSSPPSSARCRCAASPGSPRRRPSSSRCSAASTAEERDEAAVVNRIPPDTALASPPVLSGGTLHGRPRPPHLDVQGDGARLAFGQMVCTMRRARRASNGCCSRSRARPSSRPTATARSSSAPLTCDVVRQPPRRRSSARGISSWTSGVASPDRAGRLPVTADGGTTG